MLVQLKTEIVLKTRSLHSKQNLDPDKLKSAISTTHKSQPKKSKMNPKSLRMNNVRKRLVTRPRLRAWNNQ